jgi:hypothetical protein
MAEESGKDAKSEQESEGASSEEVKQLQTKLAEVEERLKEAQSLTTDPDYLEWLADRRRREDAGEEEEERKPARTAPPQAVDWEALKDDPKALAAYIVQVLREDVKAVAGGIDSSFGKVTTELDDLKTAFEIDRVARAHPDFWDYKDEIVRMSREHPDITPLEAYERVVGRKALKGEYKPKEEADREARGAGQERPGGLSARATTPSKKKSLDEAIESAWESAGLRGETIG